MRSRGITIAKLASCVGVAVATSAAAQSGAPVPLYPDLPTRSEAPMSFAR